MINYIELGVEGRTDKIDFTDNINQLDYINAIFIVNNDAIDLRTIEELADEYASWGGFRSGKSFIQQFVAFFICVLFPGVKALYVRATYDQLKDTVIAQFNDQFEQYEQYNYLSASKRGNRMCLFHNRSELRFRAFDKDTNILSAEYDVIFVCQAEDIPEELFLQLLGRLSGKRLKKPLLFTEGNPAYGWAYERYNVSKDQLEKKKIWYRNFKTEDNKRYLPENYMQKLKDNYPQWWIDRYLNGLWDNRSDSVFESFDEALCVIDPVSPADININYKQRKGMDYGWTNPTAILWAYIDYDSNLIIYDEFYEVKQLPEQIAEADQRYNSYFGKTAVVADYAIKSIKTGTAQRPDKNRWDDLYDLGMYLIESNKDELRNIIDVNRLLKQGKLKICRNCVNLIAEMKNYKWKQAKLGETKYRNIGDTGKTYKEQTVDKDNHAIDALLYLVADLEELKSYDIEEAKQSKQTLEYMTKQVNEKKWINYG